MLTGEKANYRTRGTKSALLRLFSLGSFPILPSSRVLKLAVTLLLASLFALATSAHAQGLLKLDTDTGFNAVYVHEDPDALEVMVSVTFLVGEVDATGPEGLSHYLEHLMFWHADKINDEPFHDRGGNAWVNGFITNYFNVSETDSLDDMLEFAARLFSPPELENRFMVDERKIVEREYDLRYLDNPEAQIFSQLRKKLYGETSVGRSVMGTPETIAALSIVQALGYHKRFYHPANAVLFISGDIDAEDIKEKVNTRFGEIPAGPAHTPEWRAERVTPADDYLIQSPDSNAEHERLLFVAVSGWAGSKDPLQDIYTANLLRAILTSALPGSLAIPLRMENFVVSEYELYLNEVLNDHFELVFVARADEGITWQAVSNEFRTALESIAEAGIPEKTLERMRKRFLQTERRIGTDSQEAWYRAHEHLSFGLEPNTQEDNLQRIEAVSLNDINSLLRALASPLRRASAYVLPKDN